MAKAKQSLQNQNGVIIGLVVAVFATNLFWFRQHLLQKDINTNQALTNFNQQVQINDLKLCINKNLKDCKYNALAQE